MSSLPELGQVVVVTLFNLRPSASNTAVREVMFAWRFPVYISIETDVNKLVQARSKVQHSTEIVQSLCTIPPGIDLSRALILAPKAVQDFGKL